MTERESEIICAKSMLENILLFKPLKIWQPVRVLNKVAKQEGISRSALREARRELGLLSIAIDGEQCWAHPSRVKR